MVGTTAQIVALAAQLNARRRLLPTLPFLSNSTCQFCEFVHFVSPGPQSPEQPAQWQPLAATPDDWLLQQTSLGRGGLLVHLSRNDPRVSDRMLAGMVGGGGRWLLATVAAGRGDVWEAGWKVGDQKAADRRIWQVTYARIAQDVPIPPPTTRPVISLQAALLEQLRMTRAFSDQHNAANFSACFQRAIDCLATARPILPAGFPDLAPAGLLASDAARLLAACQAAWVFGGMGSWNDQSFEPPEQARYDALSEGLYSLLNEGISASVNSAAAEPSGS